MSVAPPGSDEALAKLAGYWLRHAAPGVLPRHDGWTTLIALSRLLAIGKKKLLNILLDRPTLFEVRLRQDPVEVKVVFI